MPTFARVAPPFEQYDTYPSDSAEYALCRFAAAWRDHESLEAYTKDTRLIKRAEETEIHGFKIRVVNTQSETLKRIRCDVWTGSSETKSEMRLDLTRKDGVWMVSLSR